jgi:hypothetical protein
MSGANDARINIPLTLCEIRKLEKASQLASWIRTHRHPLARTFTGPALRSGFFTFRLEEITLGTEKQVSISSLSGFHEKKYARILMPILHGLERNT